MRKLLLFIALLTCTLLSQAQVSEAQRTAAIQLVSANKTALGLSDKDINDAVVSSTYQVTGTDVTMVYLQQSYLGIPIYNQLQVLAFKNGKLVSNAGSRLASMEKRSLGSNEMASVSAVQALRSAFVERNITEKELPVPISNSADGHKFEFGRLGVSLENIKTELIWMPADNGLVHLAWQIFIAPVTTSDYWLIRIDAKTGSFINKTNLTVTCNWDDKKHSIESHLAESHFKNGFNSLVIERQENNKKDWRFHPFSVTDANYTVIKYPAESPQHPGGAPSVHNKPWLLTPGNATAFGWHDDGTVVHDSTRGNNVWAQEDRDNNNTTFGLATNSTTPQPTLNFPNVYNFALAPTEATLNNQKAAITNLFYWNNLMHDIAYAYGFDEVSGNFQNNNQGLGGLGGDYVIADAQDAGGTNNANFATPVDGTRPRMQMYLWTTTTPNRDGDLDNGVINHEFTHGISTRLTGGPANSSCLNNAEEGGEGWSDYFALMTTTNWATATINDGLLARPIGTYVLGQPVTGAGIRNFPYSTNLAINPLTYSFVQSSGGEVHNIGEVWCVALWEMTWEIIKQDNAINANLFVPGPVASMIGNSAALKLVVEGMRLQPCSPGFIDARNAILKADTIFFNKKYSCSIIRAFAKRGMGIYASEGSSNSTSDQIVDFTTDASSFVLNTNAAAVPETQNIIYTNNVSAGGCTPINNFTLRDTLPSNVTYVSGGTYDAVNRVVSFNPVTIPNGVTQSYVFTVNINAGSYFPPVVILDEPVAGATIPATWTETSTTATHWVVSNVLSHSAPNSFFSADMGFVSDQILATTNSFALGANPPILSFWHNYNLESGYDGAVLEISIDGGSTWQDIGAANFLTNGYNGSISTAFGSPLAGRQAFTGNSNAFVKSTVNLTPYANQANVKLRFRFASDNSVAATGWYVDDINITLTAVVNMRSSLFNASNVRTATSDTVTQILPSGCLAPSITTQPVNKSICVGQNTTFSVVATSAFPMTYQWQINQGAGFINLINNGPFSTVTTPTLTITSATAALSGNLFRCIITIPCTSATSASATLTVSPVPTLSVSPNGSCSPVVLTATGTSNTYAWSPATGLSSTTGATVTSTVGVNTTYTVTGTITASGCTNTATVSVLGNSTSAILNVPIVQLNEGFGTVLPPNWSIKNNSNPVGATDWFQGNAATFPANSGATNSYAAANFNATTGANTISDWLITPVINLKNGDQFSFYTRTTTGTFPDRLEARLSTAGASTNVGTLNTDVGDFTTVLVTVNPSLTTTGYPTVWTKYTATISGLSAPATGRIAFRYFVTNGGPGGANSDYIGVDDVTYTTPGTTANACAGSGTSMVVNITGGVSPYTIVYSNGTTNTTLTGYISGTPIPITPSANTTYTLVSVTSANGCAGTGVTGTVSVTVSPAPTISVSPNNQCATGSGVVLTATGTSDTYAWTPAAGLSATTGAVVTANPVLNTTYTVTGTIAATGCTASATATVNITPAAPVITPSSVSICAGAITPLTVTPVLLTTPGGGALTIPSVGNATPYPSTISVGGLPASGVRVKSVSVTGISHTYSGDIDMMLQAPDGTYVILLSDVGTSAVNANLVFDDAAATFVPAPIVSGTYKPTNAAGPDNFPAPGPGSVTQINGRLSYFAGNLNGGWKLFVVDDAAGDQGSITNWSITFEINGAVWSPVTGLYTDAAATIPYIAGTVSPATIYAKPTATTTYVASVSNSTCTSATTSAVVTVILPVAITTQPLSQPVCVGSNATFTVVASGTSLSYQWQISTNGGTTWTNITGANSATLILPAVPITSTASQYRVIITNSCTTVTSNAVTLTVNALPTVTAGSLANRICLSDTLIPLVGTPTGGSWSGIGVSGFNFIPTATALGTYTLTYSYTNAAGCTATATTTAKVEDCPERIRLLRDNAVILYPNPNNGRFNIRMNSTLYNYLGMRVFNTAGQLIRVQNFGSLVYGRVLSIDLTNLPADVYMVKFYYDDGIRTSAKTFKVIVGGH